MDLQYPNTRGLSQQQFLLGILSIHTLPGAGFDFSGWKETWLIFPPRLVVRSQDVFGSVTCGIVAAYHYFIYLLRSMRVLRAIRLSGASGQADKLSLCPTVEATREMLCFARSAHDFGGCVTNVSNQEVHDHLFALLGYPTPTNTQHEIKILKF